MKKILNINKIVYLILLSLIAKIFAYQIYADNTLDHEWAFIIHNYEISGIMGFNVLTKDQIVIPKFAETGETVLPNIFMPPLYIYFIILIKYALSSFFNLASSIIVIQIFLSLISIIIFNKILSEITSNKKIIFILTIIFAFFPLNIYAVTQISSITLQIFLTLLFFYYLMLTLKNNNISNLFLLSFFSGFLILIRGEFFLFYLFTIFYFFIFHKKKFRFVFISMIITLITISPYLTRNYYYFETFTLTKSFGYNLLKGNNPLAKVEGNIEISENIMRNKNKEISIDNNYEIKLDNLYREKAISFIKEDPLKYLKLYILKIFAFIFIDFNSTYPNYYNILHIIPKVFISILSLIGAILVINKKGVPQYLSTYYFLNILLFSVFFILPRYSLILLPIQLMLSAKALEYLKLKFLN